MKLYLVKNRCYEVKWMLRRHHLLCVALFLICFVYQATAEESSMILSNDHPYYLGNVEVAYRFEEKCDDGTVYINEEVPRKALKENKHVILLTTFQETKYTKPNPQHFIGVINSMWIYLSNGGLSHVSPRDALKIATEYIDPDILQHYECTKMMVYPALVQYRITYSLIDKDEASRQFPLTICISLNDSDEDGYIETIRLANSAKRWQAQLLEWDGLETVFPVLSE